MLFTTEIMAWQAAGSLVLDVQAKQGSKFSVHSDVKAWFLCQVSLATLILLKRKCSSVPEKNLVHGRY